MLGNLRHTGVNSNAAGPFCGNPVTACLTVVATCFSARPGICGITTPATTALTERAHGDAVLNVLCRASQIVDTSSQSSQILETPLQSAPPPQQQIATQSSQQSRTQSLQQNNVANTTADTGRSSFFSLNTLLSVLTSSPLDPEKTLKEEEEVPAENKTAVKKSSEASTLAHNSSGIDALQELNADTQKSNVNSRATSRATSEDSKILSTKSSSNSDRSNNDAASSGSKDSKSVMQENNEHGKETRLLERLGTEIHTFSSARNPVVYDESDEEALKILKRAFDQYKKVFDERGIEQTLQGGRTSGVTDIPSPQIFTENTSVTATPCVVHVDSSKKIHVKDREGNIYAIPLPFSGTSSESVSLLVGKGAWGACLHQSIGFTDQRVRELQGIRGMFNQGYKAYLRKQAPNQNLLQELFEKGEQLSKNSLTEVLTLLQTIENSYADANTYHSLGANKEIYFRMQRLYLNELPTVQKIAERLCLSKLTAFGVELLAAKPERLENRYGKGVSLFGNLTESGLGDIGKMSDAQINLFLQGKIDQLDWSEEKKRTTGCKVTCIADMLLVQQSFYLHSRKRFFQTMERKPTTSGGSSQSPWEFELQTKGHRQLKEAGALSEKGNLGNGLVKLLVNVANIIAQNTEGDQPIPKLAITQDDFQFFKPPSIGGKIPAVSGLFYISRWAFVAEQVLQTPFKTTKDADKKIVKIAFRRKNLMLQDQYPKPPALTSYLQWQHRLLEKLQQSPGSRFTDAYFYERPGAVRTTPWGQYIAYFQLLDTFTNIFKGNGQLATDAKSVTEIYKGLQKQGSFNGKDALKPRLQQVLEALETRRNAVSGVSARDHISVLNDSVAVFKRAPCIGDSTTLLTSNARIMQTYGIPGEFLHVAGEGSTAPEAVGSTLPEDVFGDVAILFNELAAEQAFMKNLTVVKEEMNAKGEVTKNLMYYKYILDLAQAKTKKEGHDTFSLKLHTGGGLLKHIQLACNTIYAVFDTTKPGFENRFRSQLGTHLNSSEQTDSSLLNTKNNPDIQNPFFQPLLAALGEEHLTSWTTASLFDVSKAVFPETVLEQCEQYSKTKRLRE